jgi:hypothetical protein
MGLFGFAILPECLCGVRRNNQSLIVIEITDSALGQKF